MFPYLLTVRIPYFPEIFNRNFLAHLKPKWSISTGIPEGLRIMSRIPGSSEGEDLRSSM